MDTKYVGLTGKEYYLSQNVVSEGGEGIIYEVTSSHDLVAKIFKKMNKEKENKLLTLVKTNINGGQFDQLAWPRDVLYGKNGVSGYVMSRVDKAVPIEKIYGNGFKNDYDIRYRVLVAINLCFALKTVHELEQVCGDFNPQNIYVNLDKKDTVKGFHVTLLDTDSYHISFENRVYRCKVGIGEYLAPEILWKLHDGYTLMNMPLPSFTKETDLFTLAVHIFQLLTNGHHPYEIKDGTVVEKIREYRKGSRNEDIDFSSIANNIRQGVFPYVDMDLFPAVSSYFSLPENVTNLFMKTFVDGYKKPEKRASEDEWIEALLRLKFIKDELDDRLNSERYYFA